MNKTKIIAIITASMLLLSSCGTEKNTDTDIENNEIEEQQNDINTDINSDDKDNTDSDNEDAEKTVSQETEAKKNDFASESLDTFFDDAAFVGDSVLHGLNLYASYNDCCISDSMFLTQESFATYHALKDEANKYFPVYNGKNQQYAGQNIKIEKALQLDGIKKVFISFGLNDVLYSETYPYSDKYIEFAESIKESNPDIKVFFMSATYPVASANPSTISAQKYKDKLCDLNYHLKEYANDHDDFYFIDIISSLISSNEFLSAEYCSDNYVHLKNSAYEIWVSTLENNAQSLINNGETIETNGKFTPVA